MDTLATNKSAIVGSSQFVKYYTHGSGDIIDTRLSTRTVPSVQTSTDSFSRIGEGTSYMLTVTGTDGVSVFACDKSTVDHVLPSSKLSNIKNNWDDNLDAIKNIQVGAVSDIPQALKTIASNLCEMSFESNNSLVCWDSWQNSVRNCFTLPIDVTELGGSSSEIILGRLETSKYGSKNPTRIIHDSATVSIPWQVNDWRRNNPYHHIYLYIPYIGLIGLSASEIIGSTSITVNASLDSYSGSCIFQAVASNGAVLGHWSTCLASDYAIGSSNISVSGVAENTLGMATSVAGGMVSTALQNPLGVISAEGSLINHALGLCNPIDMFNSTIGTNTGMAGQGLGNNVRCISVFHNTTVTPGSISELKGTPYNGVMAIPSSGYVECVDASVDSIALGNEKDEINNYLNRGIYIE